MLWIGRETNIQGDVGGERTHKESHPVATTIGRIFRTDDVDWTAVEDSNGDLVFDDLGVPGDTATVFDIEDDPETGLSQSRVASAIDGKQIRVQVGSETPRALAPCNVDLDNGWSGVGSRRPQSPNLYEMLVQPADAEGIPDLDDFDRRVWAALTQVEGHLDAINAYDDAVLSFGPLQQTLGSWSSKGELQGALEAVRRKRPDLFHRYFGRYGLGLTGVQPQSGVDKGYTTLHGDEPMRTPEEKRPLRDFKWIYRCVEAMKDLAFREAFLEYGLNRLNLIRDEEVTLTVEPDNQAPYDVTATIGEIFRTDLGQALLLDTHINRPAYIWPGDDNNIWVNGCALRFAEWRIKSPEDLTQQQEYVLVLDLIDQRQTSSMYQPPMRTAKLLYYTELEVIDALAQAAGYEERDSFIGEFVGVDITRKRNSMDHVSNADRKAAKHMVQNHGQKVLSFSRRTHR